MALALTIRVDDRVLKRIAHAGPERIRSAILTGLRRGSEVVVKQAKQNLQTNRTTAFGALSASIWYELDESTAVSKIGPGLMPSAATRGRDPGTYGAYVEFGRGPGRMPPPQDLRLWVQRKVGGDPEEILWPIVRAIGQRGTKPAPFLVPALQSSESAINAAVGRELEAVVSAMDRER